MKLPPAWTTRLSPAAAVCLDVALTGLGRADLSPMGHDHAAEQAELQRSEWKLVSALSTPESRPTPPPASANAELKANPISHP